jgi:hypothetical protein
MPSNMYVIFGIYTIIFSVYMFFIHKNGHKYHDKFHEK